MPLLWPARCRGEWSLRSNEAPHFSTQSSLNSPRTRRDDWYRDGTFSVLPASIVSVLEAQVARFRQDLETALSLIPTAKDAYRQSSLRAEDSFKYAWCIVNTRCLYFDPSPPKSGHRSPQNQLEIPVLADDVESPAQRNRFQESNQYMVLCPLIDLFNHTSNPTSACKVTHNSSGFTITSPEISTGAKGEEEELFVSYGPHSNDFLFVEYGFLLRGTENTHDAVSLDSAILPALNTKQKRRLDTKGYSGEYTLLSPQANGGEAAVCWRTEVVAKIGLLSAQQWEGFVDGLVDEDDLGDEVKEKARTTIRTWVETTRQHAERSVSGLEVLAKDPNGILKLFADDFENPEQAQVMTMSTDQRGDNNKITEREARIARRRYDLVLERWRQILHICDAYLHQDQI
ncbi:hypothetical protein EPUS_05006 [Endocarpon pusillum Z07020]|uniref:SET domain-containing protein n=1 Tax=Endocarpon pusillum (strain Z07020 / HMAS-L-300199) TaxID=1263415 RepID=U1GIX5_ENDPU|nr:uncharacterized protein EPUS_05006 [Endocarpon pusillum Z07020]ERF72088.1 hypothetical protein EPUS_05006 [Endocarpon pusillum Z07020]